MASKKYFTPQEMNKLSNVRRKPEGLGGGPKKVVKGELEKVN